MFQSIKRYVALFILIGLIGSLPAFAHTVKTGKPKKAETFTVDFEGGKNNGSRSKAIQHGTAHSYRLNLKQGQTVEFKLRSNKALSVNVKSPSGVVKQANREKDFHGVLSGEGEFVIEVTSEDFAFYTLTTKNK